jgi:hypothetical protein
MSEPLDIVLRAHGRPRLLEHVPENKRALILLRMLLAHKHQD